MAIYCYYCTSCKYETDLFRKMTDAPIVIKCPGCGKKTFHKQVSAASIQLKGTGWYATDFKNGAANS